MNVYFVRHGQSEGNKDEIHQGQEASLSDKGREQAKIVSGRLRNISIDFVYSSPYLRAKQTAEIISKELGIQVEFWDDLKERNRPTEVEGLHIDDPKALEIRRAVEDSWINSNDKYSDEETFEELKRRADSIINHLLKKHKNQNILCITHAAIMKMTIGLMIFGDNLNAKLFLDFYSHLWIANTGITQVEFTDKYGWGLLTWNDIRHL